MEGHHHHHHHHGMKVGSRSNSSSSSSTLQYDHDHDHDHDHQSSEDDQMIMMAELRRGPWTVEEDLTLMNYIANHGEGRWNSLARGAGLKRTGKSCRLRWLNYLRPDVRRGNITLEEQLLILELHSRWGNRWSKIAQHLPGRTDNEIKNYWRTRVQKHAKQLKCDVNSKQFKDTMRYLWMPRLVERIQACGGASTGGPNNTACMVAPTPADSVVAASTIITSGGDHHHHHHHHHAVATASSTPASSDSFVVSPVSDMTTEHYSYNYNTTPAAPATVNPNYNNPDQFYYNSYVCNDQMAINSANNSQGLIGDFQAMDNQWLDQSEMTSLWNTVDDVWFLQQ